MKNTTRNNLQVIWGQLDNASGNLYQAFENIFSISTIPENIKKHAEYIDITAITGLKNEIEELIDKYNERVDEE